MTRRPSAVLAVPSVLALAVAVVGCGIGARVVVTPAPSPATSPTLSPTLLAARAQVFATLAAAGLQVIDARTSYRPGESPALTAAPRTVLQALLPTAPDRGFVVIYELADPGTATAAAQELAQYLATGPGRIQFPNDAHFSLRQVGAALVFHVWSPSGSPDQEGEQAIETALAALGQGYVIAR